MRVTNWILVRGLMYSILGGFISPSLIKMQSELPSTTLGVVLMFPIFFQVGTTVWRRILSKKQLLYLPIVLDIIGYIVIFVLLYNQKKVLAIELLIVLMGGIGILFNIRRMLTLDVLKSEMKIDGFMSKLMTTTAIGSLIGLGLASLLGKILDPVQTIQIDCIGNLILIPIQLKISKEVYKKLKNQT